MAETMEGCVCSADPEGGPWCAEKHPAAMVFCTRPPGHEGDHVACTATGPPPSGEHRYEEWSNYD